MAAMNTIGEQALEPVISIRNMRKDRLQGSNEAYSLLVPVLDVCQGEKILITGPSGSGKSTLLDMLGMALKPDAADSFVFRTRGNTLPKEREERTGVSASYITSHESFDIALAWKKQKMEHLANWRQHVGYVLQTGGLLPFLTVRENILSQHRLLGLPKDAMADNLAETLGITRLLRKLPSELSVGERQRAAIARALVASPPLVLADEPTAALDPANAAGVLRLFSQVVSELGSTLIMVSHAPEQMRGMGFRELRVELEATDKAGVIGTHAVLREAAGSRPQSRTRSEC